MEKTENKPIIFIDSKKWIKENEVFFENYPLTKNRIMAYGIESTVRLVKTLGFVSKNDKRENTDLVKEEITTIENGLRQKGRTLG